MNEEVEKRLEVEALIVLLKHQTEWLEKFIEERKNINITNTGKHDITVENLVRERATEQIKKAKRNLQKLRNIYGHNRPFTDLALEPMK